MKILTALNAFKGAPKDQNVVAVNEAIAAVFKNEGHEVVSFPIADGGDGTIDAFIHHAKTQGGIEKQLPVKDPLGRDVTARWLYLPKDETAIIEMAQASGLALLHSVERDPLKTTSYGTGQLVEAALEEGAKTILLTVGGSATVDGGMGMLKSLGAKFKDAAGNELNGAGEDLEKVTSVDLNPVRKLLGDAKLIFLCDVKTPFISETKSGHNVLLYAPQKFPNQDCPPVEAMATLQRGIENFSKVIDVLSSGTPSHKISTGAAGGITYIPQAQFEATTEPGFERLATRFNLEDQVKAADVIITGEGRLDESTFEDKAPQGLIKLAKRHNKKVVFVCGGSDNRTKSGSPIDWKSKGIDLVVQLLTQEQAADPSTLKASIQNTLKNIVAAIASKVKEIKALIP